MALPADLADWEPFSNKFADVKLENLLSNSQVQKDITESTPNELDVYLEYKVAAPSNIAQKIEIMSHEDYINFIREQKPEEKNKFRKIRNKSNEKLRRKRRSEIVKELENQKKINEPIDMETIEQKIEAMAHSEYIDFVKNQRMTNEERAKIRNLRHKSVVRSNVRKHRAKSNK